MLITRNCLGYLLRGSLVGDYYDKYTPLYVLLGTMEIQIAKILKQEYTEHKVEGITKESSKLERLI